MLTLIILSLLTLSLCICLKKILDRNLNKTKKNYAGIKNEYDKLLAESRELKHDNANLKNTLEQVIALYDITKQICKSLDADKAFGYFKEEISRHIEVGDCRFLKSDADLSPYKDYIILPLEIDKSRIGYLAASEIQGQDKDRFNILAQQFLLGIKRALLYQRVQELAITDGLTQISSRRHYLERFNEEIERSKKFKYSFCCLMIDIDHFKRYNDRYGHLVGDAILKEVSRTIEENIRQIDLSGRYGGEEFSIVLTETGKEQAEFVAGRIRQAIENKYIKVYDEKLKVTISIGISVFPEDGKSIETLIDKADSALYQAKQTGRNRVCIYQSGIHG
jgi:diguanylate cyclase (GGDEF)-like protein